MGQSSQIAQCKSCEQSKTFFHLLYFSNTSLQWNEHKLRHAYLKIDDPNAVLNIDEAEFEDQADAELASQVIALSEEKSEIDYIRAHLG